MVGVWIGFERIIDIEIMRDFIKSEFDLKECYFYTMDIIGELLESLGYESIPDDIALYEVSKRDGEFPVMIDFLKLEKNELNIRIDIYIAYKLSKVLNCRTITDGSGFGSDSSGYWSIIFDKGMPRLVDDLETKFMGDGDRELQIVRRMDIRELQIK